MSTKCFHPLTVLTRDEELIRGVGWIDWTWQIVTFVELIEFRTTFETSGLPHLQGKLHIPLSNVAKFWDEYDDPMRGNSE